MRHEANLHFGALLLSVSVPAAYSVHKCNRRRQKPVSAMAAAAWCRNGRASFPRFPASRVGSSVEQCGEDPCPALPLPARYPKC